LPRYPGRGTRDIHDLDSGVSSGARPFGALTFKALEVLIEGKPVAGGRLHGVRPSLVPVDQVLHAGAVRPVAHILPPTQALRAQQPPTLQVVVRARNTRQRPWHLAGRWVRPMR